MGEFECVAKTVGGVAWWHGVALEKAPSEAALARDGGSANLMAAPINDGSVELGHYRDARASKSANSVGCKLAYSVCRTFR